ncbi:MAG: hypothetical protein J2P18_01760 [Nocardia sp.]|nr:hypothetical protein [Nocardia sp.]
MSYPPGPGPWPNGNEPHRSEQGWGGQYLADPNPPDPNVAWNAQQSGWGAQQPWEAPPLYGGGPPTRPPKNNTGAMVAIVFGVIAILVICTGIIVVATHRHSGGDDQAGATSALASATTTETSESTRPTTGSARPGNSAHISYQEFAHNWDYKLGGNQLHADWVQGRDHPTCSDIEVAGKLTGLGCQYAAEMVYKAEGGSLMLTQFILGMDSEDHAASAHGKFGDADLKLRPGTYVDHFALGKWKDGAEKQYVVITLATATGSVNEDVAKNYLSSRHADILGALIFH